MGSVLAYAFPATCAGYGYQTTATSTRSALASTDSTLYDSALTFYSANKKEVSTSALVTSVTDGPRTGYASGTGIGS